MSRQRKPSGPAPATTAPVAHRYEKQLGRQSYAPRPRIEGVQLHEIRRHVDDGGDFQELGRLTEGAGLGAFPGFVVRQINYSTMEPGAVKAFHLHFRQDDVWFVPPEQRLLVGLLDCRKDSASREVSQRIVLGAGRSQLLYIPRGVAHGAANLGRRTAAILYLVNQQFSAEDADEQRLPWDLLGAEFWSLSKG